jgi:uncharacterized protein (DUF849 family)
MIPTRDLSPRVPLQPIEIVRDVNAAAEIGITMVHIHARDEDGAPTYKKEVYAPIIAGIREQHPDLIICVSCSGRDFTELEQRADVLNLSGDLRPDMASLTLSSLNFSRQASITEPRMVQSLAQRMVDRGIRPELEIFDLGMANYARYLGSKIDLQMPLYANVMLGNIATAQADLLSITALVQSLPANMLWSLAGIGSTQISVTALAATIAPGVRIGLEDCLWFDRDQSKLATNSNLVRRTHQMADLVDRPIMLPRELRALLQLDRSDTMKANNLSAEHPII